jgi:hypothetical protein
MVADDFVAGIALEALGAGVPGADPSLRVQHVDRIVDDRVDEQLGALLLGEGLQVAQGSLGLVPDRRSRSGYSRNP